MDQSPEYLYLLALTKHFEHHRFFFPSMFSPTSSSSLSGSLSAFSLLFGRTLYQPRLFLQALQAKAQASPWLRYGAQHDLLFPLTVCPPEPVLLLFEACESAQDALTITATCRHLHNVGRGYTVSCISSSAFREILCFDDALTAVCIYKVFPLQVHSHA